MPQVVGRKKYLEFSYSITDSESGEVFEQIEGAHYKAILTLQI